MNPDYTLARAAMVGWSDRTPERPAAGGRALTDFVTARAALLGDHVLVLGPHSDDLIQALLAALPAGATVTALVRGSTDAEDLAQRFPALAVVCGDLGDLPAALVSAPTGVVAVDGLGRVTSVESTPDSWSDRLAALRAVLADQAPVLLRVENPLSPAALGRVPGRRSADTDADWIAPDSSGPPTRDAARALLNESGLWSVFGDPAAPGLIVAEGAATPGSGTAALALAHTPGTGTVDERVSLRAAADAGRLDDFAPAWLLGPGKATPPPSALPAGTLFEAAFLDRVAAHDVGAARELLAAAVTLLGEGPALPHTVVVTADGHCARLLVEHSVSSSDDAALAFCAALATRMVVLGVRHPWPTAADRAELTRLLLAATGRDVDVDAVVRALPALPELRAEGVEAAAAQTLAVRERERAFREELDQAETRINQLTEALAARGEVLAQVRINLGKARENVKRLRASVDNAQVRQELEDVRTSTSYRLGRALTSPARLFGRQRNPGER